MNTKALEVCLTRGLYILYLIVFIHEGNFKSINNER